VENYLKVMALLLSLEDIKKQTLRAATVIFSATQEVTPPSLPELISLPLSPPLPSLLAPRLLRSEAATDSR
jgi:hypothetical protein